MLRARIDSRRRGRRRAPPFIEAFLTGAEPGPRVRLLWRGLPGSEGHSLPTILGPHDNGKRDIGDITTWTAKRSRSCDQRHRHDPASCAGEIVRRIDVLVSVVLPRGIQWHARSAASGMTLPAFRGHRRGERSLQVRALTADARSVTEAPDPRAKLLLSGKSTIRGSVWTSQRHDLRPARLGLDTTQSSVGAANATLPAFPTVPDARFTRRRPPRRRWQASCASVRSARSCLGRCSFVR
jgi:hypothetical protein